MNIPRFWARAIKGYYTGFGWSFENQAAADAHAAQRLEVILQRLKAHQAVDLNKRYYADRPMREPIMREIAATDGSMSAMITRNSYGCLVLNTASMLFVDVDFGPKLNPFELLRGEGGFFARLFGRSKPVPVVEPLENPETGIIKKAAQWAAEHPGWGWRIYRTKAGLRLVATHATVDPESGEVEAVFDAHETDPLYRILCKNQRCFRARLTPKPWRCDMDTPPARWPWSNPVLETAFNKWEKRYISACRKYATCELITKIGSELWHPDLQPLIELHDSSTGVGSGLPLA